MSDTLPAILSIQSINSRAPGDETHEVRWNPIWENLEDDTPVWEYTPPGFSAPLSPSHMEGGSPISKEESVATSGEISTATKPTPVSSTPTTERLPAGYHALKDIMYSRTPSTSSIWSRTIAPTTKPFFSTTSQYVCYLSPNHSDGMCSSFGPRC